MSGTAELDETVAQEVGTMGWLSKLFGKRTPGATLPPAAELCPHTALVPRWDSAADMGQDDKVTGYTCQACQQTFTAEAGRTLLRTEAERLAQLREGGAGGAPPDA